MSSLSPTTMLFMLGGLLIFFTLITVLRRNASRNPPKAPGEVGIVSSSDALSDTAIVPQAKRNPLAQLASLPIDQQIDKMRKSIRSWAWISLVIGAVSLVIGQVLSAPWGVVQIMVGLASFYFHSDYAMFMIYTGVFVWAAVLNIAAGLKNGNPWAFGGLLQLLWAYQNIVLFNTYRNASLAAHASAATTDPTTPADGGPPPVWADAAPKESGRAQLFFPWLSLSVGVGGALVFAAVFIGLVVLQVATSARAPVGSGFLLDLSALVGVMGAPFGIASLRAGYRPKAPSIIGIGAGVLMACVYIYLVLN